MCVQYWILKSQCIYNYFVDTNKKYFTRTIMPEEIFFYWDAETTTHLFCLQKSHILITDDVSEKRWRRQSYDSHLVLSFSLVETNKCGCQYRVSNICKTTDTYWGLFLKNVDGDITVTLRVFRFHGRNTPKTLRLIPLWL